MGNKSSKSNSNSSNLSLNSALKNGELKELKFSESNDKETICNVWIIKRTISLNDTDIFFSLALSTFFGALAFATVKRNSDNYNNKNIFKLENKSRWYFKHWAIILELSNESFVNIQFGRNGFALKEFNKTEVEGESLLQSILETWGEEGHPFSFCYLGNANKKYCELKERLKEIKEQESQNFDENGLTYYNIITKNFQHFVCEIEEILFGRQQIWHSFNYYLNDFFEKFFPNVDIDKLEEKYF